ncbi:MAG: hypothetical protein Q9203_005048 [Teloschistes exilis]
MPGAMGSEIWKTTDASDSSGGGLPLGLLNAAQGHPMLVELKNGETLNGHLVNCDTWMNLTLKEVVQTNPEGTAFFRLPESKINSRISRRVEEGAAPCKEVGEIGAEVVLEVEEDVGEAEVEEAESRRSAIYEVANMAASTRDLETRHKAYEQLLDHLWRFNHSTTLKKRESRIKLCLQSGWGCKSLLGASFGMGIDTRRRFGDAKGLVHHPASVEFKSKPSRRCLSSHPQSYDAQIRKVLDSQYSKRGERAERYRRARDFFLRSRNARLNAPDYTITNSQKARRSRDKSFFTSQDASFNTFADTSKASRSSFGLHELAARWVPSAFKRSSPVSISPKERSDYETEIEHSSGEPSVDHHGLNESLNETQGVKTHQDRPDERPQELKEVTVRDSLLAISEDYGVLSKPKQIQMKENTLELERPSPRVRTASLKRPQETSQSELSTDVLYEKLRKVSATGDYTRIHEILRTLIEKRGEQPNRRHYQAMLLGNTDAQHGSPAEVAHILQEMEAEDYLLRRHVLEELGQRWFNLSDEGWQDVIVGLLRDKQLEVAIEILQNVQQEGVRIQPWLYDLVLFNLCEAGEYDEALSILRFRIDSGEQAISGNVWHHVLDSASRAFHHEATLYAWRKRVETSYLNPSSGVCLNVLDTAARHSDSRLATDVIRILGNRSQKLQRYHYEALIESYLPSDLQTALTVLTLMASSRVRPTESSTRAIFLHLQQSSDLPESALAILRDLKQQQRLIPVEAVNVIIESYIYHDQFDTALETYKLLHTLCPSGAVTGTFNTLFRGCRSSKEIAMFLASEMVAMKVPPNALTYDRLVLVCVEASSTKEDLTDAWRYVEEMRGGGWWLRLGTAKALAKKACALGDERIWNLQGDPNEDGSLDKVSLRRMVEEEWKGEEGSTARYGSTPTVGTDGVHDDTRDER